MEPGYSVQKPPGYVRRLEGCNARLRKDYGAFLDVDAWGSGIQVRSFKEKDYSQRCWTRKLVCFAIASLNPSPW
jgi:hypothetical protein